ncbi:hypothetical protein ACSYT7_23050, partial [Escherichia coli]
QYTQLKYIQFNFWLYTTKGKNFILIIESPPRSIKNFISNIIKSTHSDFNVSNLNIKIEDFIYFLTPHFEKIQVHKAKLKDLTFSKHTSGILELESSSDALMEIRNIFKNANFTIDKVKLNVKDVTGYESLEINTNGSISLSEQIFDKVYRTIERFAL